MKAYNNKSVASQYSLQVLIDIDKHLNTPTQYIIKSTNSLKDLKGISALRISKPKKKIDIAGPYLF